jgi:hypothetical protein
VTEIGERELRTSRFAASRRFAREPLGEPTPFDGVVLADAVFRVEAARSTTRSSPWPMRSPSGRT